MNARTRFVCAGGGPLRVGSARRALANWLLARGKGGAFILRAGVQDRPAVHMLRWLGLDWDAGPERPAGRDEVCRRQAERLLAQGRAYRCACSAIPCTGACRDRSPDGRDAPAIYLDPAAAAGEASGEQEPARPADLLLVRPDGTPTSLLARTVDDHMDGITDVIEDADQRSLAEAEQALHRALAWPAPRFAYLPPLEAEPAEQPLAAYRTQGYAALPLANHLARLGWTPRGRRQLLSLSELAARFDPGDISGRPPAFDAVQLCWFNRRWLDRLDDETYLALLRPHWWRAYGQPDRAAGTPFSPHAWQHQLAATLRGQVHVPAEAAALARPLFVDPPLPDAQAACLLAEPWAGAVLGAFIAGLPAVVPFAFASLDRWISALRRRFKAEQGIRSREVMYLLRGALTGRADGPCLIVDCLLLGRARCLRRASAALAAWEENVG